MKTNSNDQRRRQRKILKNGRFFTREELREIERESRLGGCHPLLRKTTAHIRKNPPISNTESTQQKECASLESPKPTTNPVTVPEQNLRTIRNIEYYDINRKMCYCGFASSISLVDDHLTADSICMKCGKVVDGGFLDASLMEWQKQSESQNGGPAQFSRHGDDISFALRVGDDDKGLGTVIAFSGPPKSMGFKTLKYPRRNILREGDAFLKELGEKFNTSIKVVNDAFDILKKSYERPLFHGRESLRRFALASLHVAAAMTDDYAISFRNHSQNYCDDPKVVAVAYSKIVEMLKDDEKYKRATRSKDIYEEPYDITKLLSQSRSYLGYDMRVENETRHVMQKISELKLVTCGNSELLMGAALFASVFAHSAECQKPRDLKKVAEEISRELGIGMIILLDTYAKEILANVIYCMDKGLKFFSLDNHVLLERIPSSQEITIQLNALKKFRADLEKTRLQKMIMKKKINIQT